MIHDIRQTFYELLEEVPWMDDKTRVVAEEKVRTCSTYFCIKRIHLGINCECLVFIKSKISNTICNF